jgi:hypothetical protein
VDGVFWVEVASVNTEFEDADETSPSRPPAANLGVKNEARVVRFDL